jgi:hypothetical protein
MRAILLAASLLLLPLVSLIPLAGANPCFQETSCCMGAKVPVTGGCLMLCGGPLGPCPTGPASSSSSVPKCFSQIDDMINDGGTTYCVDLGGPCHVSESTEYIWGREYHCVA